eukprot:CAMPEP_0201558770 /NCGR_PEP_ID=MMETSP0173_2-20130828/69876_1 /ASSEMBLY_ACC=CAM_ASM_000268 /TAXON_ID=218659 /ORGANISM="Vexillifera sp., Strain DIVA3 564/2" /LENGTH=47 /DNA_ID= /DNA_START= /DNA_END= /DNA_ORIENTATION=
MTMIKNTTLIQMDIELVSKTIHARKWQCCKSNIRSLVPFCFARPLCQ